MPKQSKRSCFRASISLAGPAICSRATSAKTGRGCCRRSGAACQAGNASAFCEVCASRPLAKGLATRSRLSSATSCASVSSRTAACGTPSTAGRRRRTCRSITAAAPRAYASRACRSSCSSKTTAGATAGRLAAISISCRTTCPFAGRRSSSVTMTSGGKRRSS